MVLSLKAIYRLGIILALRFIQLPFWSIYYSWRPNRPRRSWTRRRAVNVRMFKRFHQVGIELGLRDGRDLSVEVPQEELEPLNARFVWIPELDEGDIVGVVAKHAAMMDVKSISIPAYWMFKEGVRWSPAHEKVQKDETVMLYFHGGAFVAGTAHPSHLTVAFAKELLKHSTSLSRVLSVDYRLSSAPPRFELKNQFPAAVIDAIAAYKYLVCDMGFLPQNITVAGDSSGGNMALAVTRYALESRLPHLPPPGGLIAASPVTDLSFSRAGPGSSHYLNSTSDKLYIPPGARPPFVAELLFGEYTYGMDREETKYNRYLSPSSKFAISSGGDGKLFSGFPPSYITGGGAEYMFDDMVAVAERMKDDGVDVTTDFPPDAVHNYCLFDWHEPERTESLIKCAAWLDSHYATATA